MQHTYRRVLHYSLTFIKLVYECIVHIYHIFSMSSPSVVVRLKRSSRSHITGLLIRWSGFSTFCCFDLHRRLSFQMTYTKYCISICDFVSRSIVIEMYFFWTATMWDLLILYFLYIIVYLYTSKCSASEHF